MICCVGLCSGDSRGPGVWEVSTEYFLQLLPGEKDHSEGGGDRASPWLTGLLCVQLIKLSDQLCSALSALSGRVSAYGPLGLHAATHHWHGMRM